MIREPCLWCRLLAIGQQCHRPAALKITDNRAVSLAAAKCEVVNADNDEFIARLFSPPTHDTQQRIVAHRHHQAVSKGRGWSATQRETKMMNDRLQASTVVTRPLRTGPPDTARRSG